MKLLLFGTNNFRKILHLDFRYSKDRKFENTNSIFQQKVIFSGIGTCFNNEQEK